MYIEKRRGEHILTCRMPTPTTRKQSVYFAKSCKGHVNIHVIGWTRRECEDTNSNKLWSSRALNTLHARSQQHFQPRYDVRSTLNGRCTRYVALVQRPFSVDSTPCIWTTSKTVKKCITRGVISESQPVLLWCRGFFSGKPLWEGAVTWWISRGCDSSTPAESGAGASDLPREVSARWQIKRRLPCPVRSRHGCSIEVYYLLITSSLLHLSAAKPNGSIYLLVN